MIQRSRNNRLLGTWPVRLDPTIPLKVHGFLLVLCLLSSTVFAQPGGCDRTTTQLDELHHCLGTGNWELVFEDEFNGNTLDLDKWRLIGHQQGSLTTHAVQQYLQLANAEVGNGTLKMHIKEESVTNVRAISWEDDDKILVDGEENGGRDYDYTGVEIWTRESFKYGKYEARIKIPDEDALFPAFWTYEKDDGHDSEIDIFDNDGGPRCMKSGISYDYDQDGIVKGSVNPGEGCRGVQVNDVGSGWHTYTCIWLPHVIRIYFDGVEKVEWHYLKETGLFGQDVACNDFDPTEDYKVLEAFVQSPMPIILTAEFRNDATLAANASLPANMEVDWVRFYRRDGCCGSIYADEPTDLDLYEKPNYWPELCKEYIEVEDVDVSELSNIEMNAEGILLKPNVHLEPRKVVQYAWQGIENPDGYILLNAVTGQCSSNKFIDERDEYADSEETKVERPRMDIYPNPSSDILYAEFDFPFIGSVELFDIHGRKVAQEQVTSEKVYLQMNVSDLPAGIYILRAVTPTEQDFFTEKLVISR